MTDTTALLDPSTTEKWAHLYTFIAAQLPKVLEPLKKVKDARKYIDSTVPQLIQESITRQIIQVSRFSNVVFGSQIKPLADYYMPMELVEDNSKTSYKINSVWSSDFIPRYKRLLIKDTAGMGKSTLLRWLLLISHPSNKIPVYVELRNTGPGNSILTLIAKQLSGANVEITLDVVKEMLKAGSFLLLLDGFDEVALNNTSLIVKELSEITETYPDNFYVISSREEKALQSLLGYYVFTITGLTQIEAETLLRKLDETQEVADRLIDLLKEDKYSSIRDFLKNPLLVSYLLKTYQYKSKIPLKKSLFYAQVYQALFETHDLRKGGYFEHEKHCKLSIDGFEKITRRVGLAGAKLGSIGFVRERWVQMVEEAKVFHPSLKFEADAYLRDLVTNVPLCMNDGVNIKWTHKALQDYFAASFICYDAAEHRNDIFKSIINKKLLDRFYNILELCKDIDEGLFDLGFTEAFLKEIKTGYDKVSDQLKELPQFTQILGDIVLQSNAHIGIFSNEFIDALPTSTEIESKQKERDTIIRIHKLHNLYFTKLGTTNSRTWPISDKLTVFIFSKSNPLKYALKFYFKPYLETLKSTSPKSHKYTNLLGGTNSTSSFKPLIDCQNTIFSAHEIAVNTNFEFEFKESIFDLLTAKIDQLYKIDHAFIDSKLQEIFQLRSSRGASNFI